MSGSRRLSGWACPGCPGRALWAQKSVWEIRVPTFEESLFVVPDHEAGLELFRAGIPRGRIWCRCRLLDLLAVGGASDFPAIAAAIVELDGGLEGVAAEFEVHAPGTIRLPEREAVE